MRWEQGILIFLSMFMIVLLLLYGIIPIEEINFGVSKNPSFYLEGDRVEMQFYKNMRFASNEITYSIEDSCSLTKKNEMTEAFDIIQNKTLLEFSPVTNGEILVTCDERNKIEEGLFVAGEGGPTKISSGENFNIILGGQILLIKDSRCRDPNIAIHELLHVLGFNHSQNDGNIMYPISKCSQTIGEEIPNKINELYSYSQVSDLKMENVSAFMNGRYLDLNVSIINQGLKNSEEAKLVLYVDNESVEEFELKEIEVGFGLSIKIEKLWIAKIKIKELKITIESDFEELSKENNQIILNKID